MRRRSTLAACTLVAVLAIQPEGRAQDDGIFEDRILFGQSAAFTGTAGDLGKDYRAGLLAAFHEINQSDGVFGRRLELVSMDDAYEPEIAVQNTQQLIDEYRVFALIGAVGTPTTRSTVPIASARGVPFLAPLSGASLFRGSDWPVVVNLRASYIQETEEIVKRLVSELGIERIGILYQEDSFGHAVLEGTQRSLNRRDLQLAGVGSYNRNTTAVKNALLSLRTSDARAVILVGAPRPIGTAIQWSQQMGFDPVHITVSFAGGDALARDLGHRVGGLFVTQVVPFPAGSSRVARRFRSALRAVDRRAAPSHVSLEGYLAGRLAIVGLERAGVNLDRIGFLAHILEGEPINLDGFSLRFGENDNQGSNRVFLTVIGRDGSARSINSLADGFQ